MSAYMPIYSGNTPPNIEGVYNMSPCVMVYDSNGSFEPGHKFNSVVTELTNQNMSQNTLTYRDEEIKSDGTVSSSSNKAEAKIVGNGDNFTMFVVITSNSTNGSWTKIASLLSGIKTSSGIKDFYEGFVMLDKYDPENKKMKIGQFRIINDQDGMSEPTTWKTRQRAARVADDNTETLQDRKSAGPSTVKQTTCGKEKAIELKSQ